MLVSVADTYTTTRGRNVTHPAPPSLSVRARVCECSVSAVYGDRRRHLPSSLALLLRPASLRYERRDFLPDEDTISDSRPGFPSRPDLGLMYKNKLVRRATHATALVYVRGGVTMNSNVCRRLAEDIHRFPFASTRNPSAPALSCSIEERTGDPVHSNDKKIYIVRINKKDCRNK